MITDFLSEPATEGDAYVIAPDGSRAGLVWQSGCAPYLRANLNGTGVNQNFIADPKGGPAGLAVNSRYIYWTNEYHNTIGRARLNGTGVNQKFITGASFPDAIAVGRRYLYWTNAAVGGNPNRRAIGRARLNGTDVNQRFVARKDFFNLHGVAVGPAR
jgi:virginiamycin B lyase